MIMKNDSHFILPLTKGELEGVKIFITSFTASIVGSEKIR